MRILFVASECAPFAKTGGLGDVVGALPKYLARRGHEVRVVLPLYQGMPWDSFELLDGVLAVPMGYGPEFAAVRLGRLPGSDVRVHFLEHRRFFDRPHLYGSPDGAYGDNLERFAFLSRGALQLCTAMNWIPDVGHAHDWQAALAPVYLDTVEWGRPLHGCASLLTIHNLAFQGEFDPRQLWVAGLGDEHLHARGLEHFGTLNLMKGGLWHATLLTTVSPNYAREIKTPEFGCGLDGVLRERAGDLQGILNGVDVDEWDPATDPHLAARFDARRIAGKAKCKAALQREAGLPERADVPLFGWVGRLAYQKGIDAFAHALMGLLQLDLQVVLLGSGDPEAARFLGELAAKNPTKFRAWFAFDHARSHRIEAGSDFFVMPSRFEPCGLNQMYSQRYGTLPIVRATGGLLDTVENYDESRGRGTGFVFGDLTPTSLYNTCAWALSTWHDRRPHVAAMRRQAMALDWSWERFAGEYERLYREAVVRRRGRTR
jgi:starch synthase